MSIDADVAAIARSRAPTVVLVRMKSASVPKPRLLIKATASWGCFYPRSSAAARSISLHLLQHGLGIGDFEFVRSLDVQLLDHAVVHEHRHAGHAHAPAARGQVELPAQLLGELGAAVGHHAYLSGRFLVAAPGAHDEGIVDRDAPDLVHAFGPEFVEIGEIA